MRDVAALRARAGPPSLLADQLCKESARKIIILNLQYYHPPTKKNQNKPQILHPAPSHPSCHPFPFRVIFGGTGYPFECLQQMKQEERASVAEQVGGQQEKLRGIYHRLEGVVDRFIDLYAQAERAVQSGQDSREVIAQLNRELLALRPLKTVREHFVHHYRKLSNLIRRVQGSNNTRNAVASSRYSRRPNGQQTHPPDPREQDDKLGTFFGGLINREEETEVLQQMIVESYLRSGEWECAGVWGKTECEVDPSGLFRESMTLREAIRKGELADAIRWCENQRIYETHNCMLEYELKLMQLLGLLQKGEGEELLGAGLKSLGKFSFEKKEEVEKLCLFIFLKANKFWEEEAANDPNFKLRLEERYRMFEYSQEKLDRLAEQFFEQYMRQNSLSRFNSLSIIYSCSQKIMEEYMRMMRLVWGGKGQGGREGRDGREAPILPFSVRMDREYQYHSLFYCPVTKEVHSSSEASKLLACGHLISDNAHNRIVQENRSRRKIKCPICQKEIKPDDSLKTEF